MDDTLGPGWSRGTSGGRVPVGLVLLVSHFVILGEDTWEDLAPGSMTQSVGQGRPEAGTARGDVCAVT